MTTARDQRHPKITIRPSPQMLAPDWRDRVRSASPWAWLIVVGVLLYGYYRDPQLGIYPWIIGGLILVTAIPNLLARVNARIMIGPDEVQYRGILRVRRTCHRTALSQAVRVKVSVLGPRFPFSQLLLLDPEGNVLVSIHEEWWPSTLASRLASELSIPVSVLAGTYSPKEINHRYPGAASLLLRHRYYTMIAAAILVIVVVGGIISATSSGLR